LRLVPIRLLQPRPHLASSYCYSGRLFFQVLRSGPATPGFPVLHVTVLPFCCPFFYPRGVTSGTKCLSGTFHINPEGFLLHFQFNSEPKLFCFLKPCDSLVERTFPVFFDFLNISGPGPSSSDFGSHDAQTRRSDRNRSTPIKLPFLFPHQWSSLLSLT